MREVREEYIEIIEEDFFDEEYHENEEKMNDEISIETIESNGFETMIKMEEFCKYNFIEIITDFSIFTNIFLKKITEKYFLEKI
jgi:hypothetical protein